MIENAAALRDALLGMAGRVSRDAEAEGLDPSVLPRRLVEAWRSRYPDTVFTETSAGAPGSHVSVEPDFIVDRATGVESLTFFVCDRRGSGAAGILLRFPSQFPDSFEPVVVDVGALDHARVRAGFFGAATP